MSLDEAIQQIEVANDAADAAKTLLQADVPDIEAAASRNGDEVDYLIESALEAAQQHLLMSRDVVERIEDYWLKCNDLAGGVPYEVIVRAAEFLAATLQIRPASNKELWQLAESSNWRHRLVAGWTVRSRSDAVATDIARKLANDKFSDDNGFFLIREAVGDYE